MMVEKDGLKFIGLFFVIGAVFLFIFWRLWPIGALFLLLALASALFFRESPVETTFDGPQIVAPASGTIIDIREVREPDFMGEMVRKISIFMSLFDEHINYAPAAGEVAYLSRQPGGFKKAYLESASEGNEAQKIGFRGDRCSWMMKQIAGVVARRIVCRCRVGDRLRAGEKLGLIRFGSRVELFFPLSASFTVSPGDRVRGGRTLIGKIT
ncbi:MAG: phosphatidylserine decarboxylase [PVC group bacterium]